MRTKARLAFCVIAAAVSLSAIGRSAAAPCTHDPALTLLPREAHRGAITLLAEKGVRVAEICGEARDPRFYARFRSDPQTSPNAGLYNRLYLALMDRLRVTHATLIDLDGEIAIGLTRNPRGDLTIDVAPWNPRR